MTQRNCTIEIPDPALTRQAVVYARVSSKEQDKEGFSIPAQLKLLQGYAIQEGIHTIHEYVDVETAKQAGRSSFGEMLNFLRKHPEARIILVEKTDRLYRNLKDWVTLDELDLEIHFVKENVVLSARPALVRRQGARLSITGPARESRRRETTSRRCHLPDSGRL